MPLLVWINLDRLFNFLNLQIMTHNPVKPKEKRGTGKDLKEIYYLLGLDA